MSSAEIPTRRSGRLISSLQSKPGFYTPSIRGEIPPNNNVSPPKPNPIKKKRRRPSQTSNQSDILSKTTSHDGDTPTQTLKETHLRPSKLAKRKSKTSSSSSNTSDSESEDFTHKTTSKMRGNKSSKNIKLNKKIRKNVSVKLRHKNKTNKHTHTHLDSKNKSNQNISHTHTSTLNGFKNNTHTHTSFNTLLNNRYNITGSMHTHYSLYLDELTNNKSSQAPKHSKLFNLILKDKIDVDHFCYVWSTWFENESIKDYEAIQTLINLIFESCGLGVNFFPITLIEEINLSKNFSKFYLDRVHTHISNYFENEAKSHTHTYPFSGKGQYKNFTHRLITFFKKLSNNLSECANLRFTTYTHFFENWLILLSTVKYRPLRLCATSIGYAILEGLLLTYKSTHTSELKFNKQLNSEMQGNTHTHNKRSIEDISNNIKSMRVLQTEIRDYFNTQYTMMFSYKMRDISSDIRLEAIHYFRRWMEIVPSWVLDQNYTQYLNWSLCDKEVEIRLEILGIIENFIKKILDKKFDENTHTWAVNFVKQNHERLITMRFDQNDEVKIKALMCVNGIANIKMLTSDYLRPIIVDSLTHTHTTKVAEAYAAIINNVLLSEPVIREESCQEDMFAHQILLGNMPKKKNDEVMEEKSKQRGELVCLLQFIKQNLNDTQHNEISSIKSLVDGLWSHAPCLRNIRLMVELLCIGETRATAVEQLEHIYRIPLLNICEHSFKLFYDNIKKQETSKTKETNDTKRLRSEFEASILYVLEKGFNLLTIHKSETSLLHPTINIIILAFFNLSFVCNKPPLDELTDELINIAKFNQTPIIYKLAIHTLSCLCENFTTNHPIVQRISAINEYYISSCQPFWVKIQSMCKGIGVDNSQLKDLGLRLSLFIQKIVHFHSTFPHTIKVDPTLLEMCANCVQFQIEQIKSKNSVNTHNNQPTQPLHTSQHDVCINIPHDKDWLEDTHYSLLPDQLVLNSIDLLLIFYEKLVFEFSNLRQIISTERKQINENENNNKEGEFDRPPNMQLHTIIKEFTLIEDDLKMYYPKTKYLLFTLLGIEGEYDYSFPLILVLLTMAQITPIWLNTPNFETYELAILHDKLNVLLQGIDLEGRRSELEAFGGNLPGTTFPFQMLPFPSFSPLIEANKDVDTHYNTKDIKSSPINHLHTILTCFEYVINCYNMEIWQSHIGTLLLVQINMKQQNLSNLSNKFLSIFKKKDVGRFFELILQTVIALHSAVINNDYSPSVVVSFIKSIVSRLGISLHSTTKMALCKFIYNLMCYNITHTHYESLLEYLKPIINKHYLNKPEIQFLEKQLMKTMKNLGKDYKGSPIEEIIESLSKTNSKNLNHINVDDYTHTNLEDNLGKTLHTPNPDVITRLNNIWPDNPDVSKPHEEDLNAVVKSISNLSSHTFSPSHTSNTSFSVGKLFSQLDRTFGLSHTPDNEEFFQRENNSLILDSSDDEISQLNTHPTNIDLTQDNLLFNPLPILTKDSQNVYLTSNSSNKHTHIHTHTDKLSSIGSLLADDLSMTSP